MYLHFRRWPRLRSSIESTRAQQGMGIAGLGAAALLQRVLSLASSLGERPCEVCVRAHFPCSWCLSFPCRSHAQVVTHGSDFVACQMAVTCLLHVFEGCLRDGLGWVFARGMRERTRALPGALTGERSPFGGVYGCNKFGTYKQPPGAGVGSWSGQQVWVLLCVFIA